MAVAVCAAVAFAAPAHAATFTVTSGAATGDGNCDVTCTLEEAITAANAAGGGDTIAFNVGGGGSQTLAAAQLPAVTDLLVVDGTSQPGFAGQPIIEVPSTLNLDAANSVIRALRLQQLVPSAAADGMVLRGSILTAALGVEGVTGAVIGGTGAGDGNQLGAVTFYAGSTAATVRGNVFSGSVMVQSGASATIGGTTAAARNRLAGGALARLSISGTATVQGNWIGLDAAGTRAAGSANYGVYVEQGGSAQIGGSVGGAGNVISGSGVGIQVAGDATVHGNRIGTNSAGTAAVPNETGISILSTATGSGLVGGAAAGEGNLISGSSRYGISVGAPGQVIRGNTFGLDAAGTKRIPNTYPVYIAASGTQVGGAAAGQGNRFEGNIAGAVYVDSGRRNRILGNAMRNNGGPGIYLQDGTGYPSYPLNDAGDGDTGPNDLQNTPVLTTVSAASATGTLASEPSENYRIEVFANTYCEVEGRGEGQRLVGSAEAVTNGAGDASFTIPLSGVAATETLTATATDAEGNTSTYSPCADVGTRTLPAPGPRPDGATNGAIAWSARGVPEEPAYGKVSYSLFSMNPDGSGATPLTPAIEGAPLDIGPVWSPDGNRIAFTRCATGLFGCNASESVYVMNADGSNLTQFAANANRPAWSPDGTKLAFAGDRMGTDAPTMRGIYVRPSDLSGPAVRVPTGGTSCPLSGPGWVGSTHLLVATGCVVEGWQGGLHVVTITTGQKALEVPRDVSNDFNFPTDLVVSPSGTLVMFNAHQDVLLLNRTTGDLINLTRTYGADGSAFDGEWSPDGAKLAFKGKPASGKLFGEIWIANADGTGAHPITDNNYDDAVPGWQPCVAATVRCGPPAPFLLSVNTSGATGSVTSSPAGIDCPSDCSEPFTRGTTVTLTVSPADGVIFTGWNGACTGTGECVVQMTQARTVTASFRPVTTPDPSPGPSPSPTPTPGPSPTPQASPTPTADLSPAPQPSPTPSPSPTATQSPGGGPSVKPTISLPPVKQCIKKNFTLQLTAPQGDALKSFELKVDGVRQKVPPVKGKTAVKITIKNLGTARKKRFQVSASRRRFHRVRAKVMSGKGQEASASRRYKTCR